MRLIDAADVCEILADMYPTDGETVISYKEIDRAYTKVQCLPTIDAVPVVHGKWIMTGGMKPPEYHHHHQCSVCEAYAPMRPPYGSKEMLTPWCPGCNAKMDLEEQQS